MRKYSLYQYVKTYGQTYLYISLGFRYIGIRGNVEHPRGKGGRIVSPDVTDLVEKHTAAA